MFIWNRVSIMQIAFDQKFMAVYRIGEISFATWACKAIKLWKEGLESVTASTKMTCEIRIRITFQLKYPFALLANAISSATLIIQHSDYNDLLAASPMLVMSHTKRKQSGFSALSSQKKHEKTPPTTKPLTDHS